MNRPSPAHRAAALVVAIATSGILATGTAQAAAVAPLPAATDTATAAATGPDTATSTPAPAGLLMPPTTASITVTAMQNNTASTVPQPGVQFTLTPVIGVDLSTPQAWWDAQAFLDPTTVPEHTYGTPIEPAMPLTDAGGTTTLKNVPSGIYLLSAEGFADAFIMLPGLTSNDGMPVSWQQDVAVYPKHVPEDGAQSNPQLPVYPPRRSPNVTPTPTPVATPAPTTSTPAPPPPASGGAGGGGSTPTNGANNPVFNAGSGSAAPAGGMADTIMRGLAYTGAELMGPVGAGLAAIAAGGALVWAARRRRREDEPAGD